MAGKFSYHVDVRYDVTSKADDGTTTTTSEIKTRTTVAATIDDAVNATLNDCATWGPEYSNFVAESCAKTGVVDVVA